MKINKRNVEAGTWYKYQDDVELKVRAMRLSALPNLDVSLENLAIQFDYCLVDWKGIETESGSAFKCNDENKQYIYDYYDGIREFVFAKQQELKDSFDKEIKN